MSGRTLSTTLPFPRSSFHLHVPTHAFVVPTFKHPREYLIRSYHCSLRNLHVYAVKIRRLLLSSCLFLAQRTTKEAGQLSGRWQMQDQEQSMQRKVQRQLWCSVRQLARH